MTDNDEPLEPITVGPSDPWGSPVAAADWSTPPPSLHRPSRSAGIVGLVIAMIVAGVAGYFVTTAARTGRSMTSATPNRPNTTPTDPRRSALTGIVVQQQDVTSD